MSKSRWTILSTFKRGKHTYCRCRCACGKERDVYLGNIKNGKSLSCGCLRAEVTGFQKTHGGTGTRLYDVWSGMKQRCFDPGCKLFQFYGARGITVCNEWATDFPTFRRWAMEHGYAEGLCIDRWPDKYGNYKPTNCRWVTQKTNMNNQRTNRIITAFGETKTMAQWSEDPRCGVAYGTIWKRLNEGWLPEDAISVVKNGRYHGATVL